jgi:L-seryl-tRNA(Ser) seleniumtransferase
VNASTGVDERQRLLRQLPSVDKLLHHSRIAPLLEAYGRPLTVEALRLALGTAREAIAVGRQRANGSERLIASAHEWLASLFATDLRPVINATGIVVHTNLGRAPLSRPAVVAAENASTAYSTLEYDLATGKRGNRAGHTEQLLTRLTNAEASLVVNNNAAAVLLMLTALCSGKRVIISRGQLVEIGGGFRIPDVMAQSGAELVEVGTTNRTHLQDYESAINDETAAILVAHHSNYRIVGFTAEPSLAELASLATRHGILLLYDQGSGALQDVEPFGLEPEPTVQEGLEAGCDLLAFSGDKLLGGPQAGILCGRADLISRARRHPLARAVRADKLCLAALGATAASFLAGRAFEEVPVWQMIAKPLAEVQSTAEGWAHMLREQGISARLIDGESLVGGGSLPGTSLPTKLVAIEHSQLDQFSKRLRSGDTPVVGRVQDGQFLIDPRTVLPGQGEALMATLLRCWNPEP